MKKVLQKLIKTFYAFSVFLCVAWIILSAIFLGYIIYLFITL